MATSNDENKSLNFKRLAEKRTNTIIERVRILGNLSNKRLYRFSDSEVEKIFSAIENAVKDVKSQFGKSQREPFRL